MVMELNEFGHLRNRLRAAVEDICQRALPINLRAVTADVLRERKLLWPDLVDSLRAMRLKEIK
jgi:hypothetical protein